MEKDPSKEEIAEWLDSIGRDRHWLADQCAASKATVDGWFSTRGFPRPALQSIRRLMGISANPAGELSRVTFNLGEFERIDAARIRAGYSNRADFYRDAIIELAKHYEKQTGANAEIDPLFPPLKVAEEIKPYGTPKDDDV